MAPCTDRLDPIRLTFTMRLWVEWNWYYLEVCIRNCKIICSRLIFQCEVTVSQTQWTQRIKLTDRPGGTLRSWNRRPSWVMEGVGVKRVFSTSCGRKKMCLIRRSFQIAAIVIDTPLFWNSRGTSCQCFLLSFLLKTIDCFLFKCLEPVIKR